MFQKSLVFAVALLMMPFMAGNLYAQKDNEPDALTNEVSKVDVNKIANTLIKRIKLSGYAHATFTDLDKTSPRDQFKISRAIFMADAQITKHVNAYFMYDFAGSALHELYFNYKASKELNVRMGQFKNPFSIENQISPSVVEMPYLYSLATTYMITGGSKFMMPSCSGRDLGVSVFGTLFKGKIDYSLAVMNGEGRGKSEKNSQKDFVAKLQVHPLTWLMISGSMIKGTGNTDVTASTTNPGEYNAAIAPGVTGFRHNGNFQRDRYAIGGTIDFKPISFRSEYMHGKDADAKSDGYYVTTTVKRILPNFDVVGSYDHLKTYKDTEDRISGGVQYWFYPKCRIQCAYANQKFKGSSAENCFYTQLQFRF